MKRGNIIVFNIDRTRYDLPHLRQTDCINLIGTVKSIKGDSVRIIFTDVFADCERHTITIQRNNILEVV